MKTSVLLVGCGNMGFAMLKGWLAGREDLDAWVVEPNDALRERAIDAGATAVESADHLPQHLEPDLIFLAVKPQVMGKVLPAYKRWADGPATFVSIAAGTTLDTMQQILSDTTPIIRCMPNTPAAVGAGAIVCCPNPLVGEPAKRLTQQLLSSSGQVSLIDDESLMDAVTAVSGSGPAYVFHFIESLSAAGEKAGLPSELAAKLAMQTVYGAALLAVNSEDTPTTLREQVTSPAGTTAAALDIFMASKSLESLVSEAVDAAAIRSRELSKG